MSETKSTSDMESVIKAFNIGFLIRSLFSGVYFCVAYLVATRTPDQLRALLEKDSSQSLVLVTFVSLIVGVSAYGFHRAVIFPIFVERPLFANWASRLRQGRCALLCRKKFMLISKSTMDIILWRWNQHPSQWKKCDRTKINEHFNKWGDFIHFQFTSVECMVLGALTGRVISPGEHHPNVPLIIVGCVILFAAYFSTWRHISFIEYVKEADPKASHGVARSTEAPP